MPEFKKVILRVRKIFACFLLYKIVRFEKEYKESMVAQNSLFNILEYCKDGKKPLKKRVRYKKPTYVKSYKFRVFNEDTQQFQYYGDEKHILRVNTLHKLYSMIYGYCEIDLFEVFEKKEIDGLTVWGEDKQAEIANTWDLPLKDRVLLHLRLLRYLREGFSISASLQRVQAERTCLTQAKQDKEALCKIKQ